MPQQTTVTFDDGRTGIVIYPDGKKLKAARYQPAYGNVVVHYEPPHEVDIANAQVGSPDLFIVPEALIPGLV